MFARFDSDGYREALPGIRMKTIVYGDKTLMTEFRMEAGSSLPSHAHPHEQTGYLVEGRMRLTIGSETFDVGRGDSWLIPGDTRHAAEILESSIAVEVFAPVREEYLPERG